MCSGGRACGVRGQGRQERAPRLIPAGQHNAPAAKAVCMASSSLAIAVVHRRTSYLPDMTVVSGLVCLRTEQALSSSLAQLFRPAGRRPAKETHVALGLLACRTLQRASDISIDKGLEKSDTPPKAVHHPQRKSISIHSPLAPRPFPSTAVLNSSCSQRSACSAAWARPSRQVVHRFSHQRPSVVRYGRSFAHGRY